MASHSEFEYEGFEDSASIVKYLDALKEGFAQKKIVFGADDEIIELHPEGLLSFELEAKKKNDKTKISIKISWRDKEPGSSAPKLDIKSSD